MSYYDGGARARRGHAVARRRRGAGVRTVDNKERSSRRREGAGDGPDGLSSETHAARFEEYGPNVLEEVKKNECLVFLSYFWGPMPIMIWVATLIVAEKDYDDMAVLLTLQRQRRRRLLRGAVRGHASRRSRRARAQGQREARRQVAGGRGARARAAAAAAAARAAPLDPRAAARPRRALAASGDRALAGPGQAARASLSPPTSPREMSRSRGAFFHQRARARARAPLAPGPFRIPAGARARAGRPREPSSATSCRRTRCCASASRSRSTRPR